MCPSIITNGVPCTLFYVHLDKLLPAPTANKILRTHLQKHEKAFKCNIPGCKNTAGFARIDQLRRHKIEVHHINREDVEDGK